MTSLARGLVAVSLSLVASGCASSVGPGALPDGATDARGDRPVVRDGGDAGRDVQYFDTNVYDVYREPPCPGPKPPPRRQYDCDPFLQRGCAAGESCYPFIEYPAQRCAAEVYRAQCARAGTSGQDAFCRAGAECAPGHACFVTGAMNRCLQLCRLDGAAPQCPRGRVCEPTDLPDFGACN